MARTSGFFGQLTGPFSAGQNLATQIGAGRKVKFGISIGEKDYMKLQDFCFKVNNILTRVNIYIGRTFIYETDDGIILSELSFPDGAPASTIINFSLIE